MILLEAKEVLGGEERTCLHPPFPSHQDLDHTKKKHRNINLLQIEFSSQTQGGVHIMLPLK
ncbi:unnamed protein product [Musa banksii]